mmetsp:Transcript_118999/g.296912  ORF Transcript_118999/g.296912 Transcript_118999/m.296912 type:complete len:139 (+) Transcript_118999:91-507(+)
MAASLSMRGITGLIDQLSVEVEALEARVSALHIENEELRSQLSSGELVSSMGNGQSPREFEQTESEADDERPNSIPIREIAVLGSKNRLGPAVPRPDHLGDSGGGDRRGGESSTRGRRNRSQESSEDESEERSDCCVV